ncbi:YkgJ family cysteine cluster protein [Candidatus Woesearchaeota archaeon]|nr:YkgJ family cysteine cluster protein [Candidatus Woesearchaeota archaeon]
MLKQLISSEDCKICKDKCCTFENKYKDYAPVFAEEEMLKILKRGFSKGLFKEIKKGVWQIKLAKLGDGFWVCPFSKKNNCEIYDVRPNDCAIWPFVLVEEDKKIFLALDKGECYITEKKLNSKELKDYANYLKEHIISDLDLGRYPKWKKGNLIIVDKIR